MGRNFGFRVECKKCGIKPPSEVRYHQRWRWMTMHEFLEHV